MKETQHFLRRAYKRKLLDDNQVNKIKTLGDNWLLCEWISKIDRSEVEKITA